MSARYPSANMANRYARDVLSGKVRACRFVRAACSRHLEESKLERQASFPYRFDKAAAERACEFVELQQHVKGLWAGRLIRLEPWQAFILCNLFGWLRKKDGLRRYREAYIEVPRKNGKSVLAAGIGLFMFVADGEPGAEVYSGATSEKQAWEVFGPARQMVLKNEPMREYFEIDARAKNMNVPGNASKFEPVIGNPGDGSSPHCAIVDEYHEHDRPDQYDTMSTGMGAREQPLLLVITTAGINLAGPCYAKRGSVVRILDGHMQNDEIFGIIFTLDDDDDWADFDNWKKANPNFGVSVFEDFLRKQHREATQVASRQNIIRTKHLNQWMNADVAWMNMLAWDRCAAEMVLPEYYGEPVWLGLDLSSKVDVASLLLVFHRAGEFHVLGKHYLPQDTVDLPQNTHYQTWRIMERLEVTPGPVIDLDRIEDDIREIARNFQVVEVAYDPFQATQLTQHLESEGITMVEVRPTVLNFSEPMKQLEALVLDGKLKHDGCPVLQWMASNVVAHVDKKDNIYPNKDRPENKIDGIVALIMALDRATRHNQPVAEPTIHIF